MWSPVTLKGDFIYFKLKEPMSQKHCTLHYY